MWMIVAQEQWVTGAIVSAHALSGERVVEIPKPVWISMREQMKPPLLLKETCAHVTQGKIPADLIVTRSHSAVAPMRVMLSGLSGTVREIPAPSAEAVLPAIWPMQILCAVVSRNAQKCATPLSAVM